MGSLSLTEKQPVKEEPPKKMVVKEETPKKIIVKKEIKSKKIKKGNVVEKTIQQIKNKINVRPRRGSRPKL